MTRTLALNNWNTLRLNHASSLCLLLCALLLTACTDKPLQLQDVPDKYFDCRDWPKQPGAAATDYDAGVYIIDGHASWQSCSQALGKLKGLKVNPRPQ